MHLTQGFILGVDFGVAGRVMAPRSRIVARIMITARIVHLGISTPRLFSTVITVIGCWVHVLLSGRALIAIILWTLFFERVRILKQDQGFCLSRRAK